MKRTKILVVYGHIRNYLKTLWLKTMDIYYLTTCVGKELRCGSTGSTDLGLLPRMQSRSQRGLQSPPDSAGGIYFSSFPHRLLASLQSSLHWLETSAPCQVGFSQHNSWFPFERGIRGHEWEVRRAPKRGHYLNPTLKSDFSFFPRPIH